MPKLIPKDYVFANLNMDTDVVDCSTCTITCGPQEFFRMEDSVKKMMTEMEQVGGLNDERLSQVLGPAKL